MSNTFPTSLNSHKSDWANDTPVEDTHPEEHNDIAEAVEALEAKVGIDSSAVTSSHDYKLSLITGSDKAASDAAVDANLTTLTDHIADVANPHEVTKTQVGLGNVDNTSDATKNAAAVTLTNKTIDVDNNTVSNLEVDNFKANVIDTDGNLAADSDTRIPTQQAVKEYVDANTSTVVQSGTYDVLENIEGATTPVPVFSPSDGDIRISDANDNARDEFLGFATDDAIVNVKHEGMQAVSDDNSFSYTPESGTNRLLVAIFNGTDSTTGGDNPTSITYDGNALTQLYSVTADEFGRSGSAVFYRAIGTDASPAAVTVALGGDLSGWEGYQVYLHVFSNVDQTTPVAGLDSRDHDTNDDATFNVTPTGSPSMLFQHVKGTATLSSVETTIASSATDGYKYVESNDATAMNFSSSQGFYISFVAEIFPDTNTGTSTVTFDGVLGGFSGLTPNAIYYVSDTKGTIGTTAGSTSLRVGKAISATQLLILH